MRLRHIEVLNAVMLTGSVSGAARLLHVTQPAVSRALQHAELRLGLTLFNRVPNGLVPTPEALALYPHVEQLFADLDAVRRVASTLRGGNAVKEIRVLSILALGQEILPRALTAFRRRHPEVQVSFRALHSPQIVSSLVLQEADVGFLYGNLQHPALVSELLVQARLVCIGAKGVLPKRAMKRGAISLKELEGQRTIALDRSDPVGAMVARASRDAGAGLVGSVAVQTYHGALALARHGHGIAVVDSCTALSAAGHDVEVLPVEPPVHIPVCALRPTAKPGSVAVKAFVRAVHQVLQEG